jgi:hypothetical protein
VGDIGPELAHYDVLPTIELHLVTAPRSSAAADEEDRPHIAAGPGVTPPAEPVVIR